MAYGGIYARMFRLQAERFEDSAPALPEEALVGGDG